jgi:hypothetical protein
LIQNIQERVCAAELHYLEKIIAPKKGDILVGLTCKIFGHKWNGCQCGRCGKIRDEQHDWNFCKCTICGRLQDLNSISDINILLRIAYDSLDGSHRKYPLGYANIAEKKIN